MSGLPKLPPQDRRGHRPAVATARALMARKIIKRRIELGLEQKDLAALAGLRAETICKLESGKNTARTETVARLEAAFKKAAQRKGPGATWRGR